MNANTPNHNNPHDAQQHKAPAGQQLPPLKEGSPSLQARERGPAPVDSISRADVVAMLHDIAARIVDIHGDPRRMAMLVADLRRHDGNVEPLAPIQTTV